MRSAGGCGRLTAGTNQCAVGSYPHTASHSARCAGSGRRGGQHHRGHGGLRAQCRQLLHTVDRLLCALRRQWTPWRAAPPRSWRPPCAMTGSSWSTAPWRASSWSWGWRTCCSAACASTASGALPGTLPYCRLETIARRASFRHLGRFL